MLQQYSAFLCEAHIAYGCASCESVAFVDDLPLYLWIFCRVSLFKLPILVREHCSSFRFCVQVLFMVVESLFEGVSSASIVSVVVVFCIDSSGVD